MNISVVCDVLGSGNNGTSVAAGELIKAMKNRGHRVNVICCDEEQIGREGYYVLPQRSFGPFNGYVKKAGVSLARPVDYMLRAGIRNADVVHCMLPFRLSRRAITIARECGIPVTAGFHCQAENFSNYLFMKKSALFNRMIYMRYYRTVFSRVDCVHYPSQFIRDEFERATHATAGRVISNGVGADFTRTDVARPNSFKGRFVILSTGRYSREKCHDVLIRAVGRSAYRDDIALVIAGEGSLEGRYREIAARERVDLRLGFVARKDMPSLVCSADLYVHPADAELEGIACLEAMKCGRTIVVSDSAKSATRTFAADGRGIFKTGSAADLARRIDYWIEHPSEREKTGEYYASCDKVRDRDACMDEMERMFADVIRDHAREATGEAARQLLYR